MCIGRCLTVDLIRVCDKMYQAVSYEFTDDFLAPSDLKLIPDIGIKANSRYPS